MSWGQSDPVVENVSASGGPVPSWGQSDPAVERPSESAADSVPKQDVDLATRAGMAGNRSAAAILGAPQDAMRWASRGITQAVGLKPWPSAPSSEEAYKAGVQSLGSNFGVNSHPDSATLATTLPEKAAEAFGSGGVEAAMMGGAAGLVARSVQASNAFSAQLMKILAGSGAASNAAMGAGGGALGAVSEDAVPDTVLGSKTAADVLRPIARMGGEIFGGGVTALAETGVRAGARPAWEAAKVPFRGPEEAAARKALGNVDLANREEFLTSLANTDATPPASGSARPPGNLTLFQATGDVAPKLGELERTAITKNPTTAMEVRQGQNETWLTQLNEMFAQDPRKALDFTRARIGQIEEEHAGLVRAARADAEAQRGQTGGAMFDDRADYGKALQDKLDDLNKQKKTAEDALWTQFREVAGNKPLPFADAKPRVKAIADDRGQFDAEIAGDEAAIFNTIQNAGEFATFKDLGRLQSRLKGIIRDPKESGETRFRMREVLNVIDDTMDQAVDRVVIDGERPLVEAMESGLTPDDVALYGRARGATRERKETFEEGVVGQVLATGERRGVFGMTESSVMGKLLKQPEAIRDFIKAAGNDQKALELAQDALAFDMNRKAAVDGVISPEKLRGWMRDNTEAMKQFPDLQAKFSNARTASERLDDAIAKQKEALESAQMKAAQKFIGDKDPHATLSEMMQRPDELRTIVDQIKQDPEAYAGLKRIAVELILRRGKVIAEEGALEGAKESGTSGVPQLALNAMQSFYYNNRRGFGEIFDKSELGNIGAVMGNIQKAARTEGGVRIPNQSNSVQDLWGITKDALLSGWRKAGTAVGMTTGVATMDPFIGAPVAAAGIAVDAWRTAYRGRMDAALADIMLDVGKAQIAIPKVVAKVEGRQAAVDAQSAARKLRALLGQEAMQALERMDEEDQGNSP